MFSALISLTSGGLLLVLALCPVHLIAWRFVRLIGAMVLTFGVAVLSWGFAQGPGGAGMPGTALSGVAVATLIGAAIVVWSRRLQPPAVRGAAALRGLSAAGGLAATAGGIGLAQAWAGSATPEALFGASLGHLLAAFLMGSVTLSWLLGHRYLTAAQMPIEPLRTASRLFGIAIIARWLFLAAVAGLAAAGMQAFGAAGIRALRGDWLMILMRVGVGLVLPSLFAWMAWQCVKLRSTQSATGILFFASVFVVIGELSSQYLAARIGLPL